MPSLVISVPALELQSLHSFPFLFVSPIPFRERNLRDSVVL